MTNGRKVKLEGPTRAAATDAWRAISKIYVMMGREDPHQRFFEKRADNETSP